MVLARSHMLHDQQDPESGLIGDQIGHAFLYDHALATLAQVDTYGKEKSPLVERPEGCRRRPCSSRKGAGREDHAELAA